MIRKQDRWPLGATGFILAVSAAWWGFALFGVAGAPEWVARARAVCFNITETGMPDSKGWLLLIGQPPAMLLALYVGWSAQVKDTLAHLRAQAAGQALIGTTVMLVLAGLTMASIRVADAQLPAPTLDTGYPMGVEPGEGLPETYPRLDRAWPVDAMVGLVDQRGEAFSLASLESERAFVTFAFGHCKTICPLVVHSARGARDRLEGEWPIVVFTLDPWRDTPSRLTALVEQFGLDPEKDRVVSGDVDAVNRALDALNIARERDLQTGDVVHPALTYMVETDGTIAYATTGAQSHLVELALRLR